MNKSSTKGHLPMKPTASQFSNLRLTWILAGVGILLVGAVFLFILVNRPAPFVPLVRGAPSALIDQKSFDYGDVHYQTVVETSFHVKNVGDESLFILQEPRVEVVEGCCPPQAVVTSRALDPGEEADVSIQFTMHEGMGGQHEFRVHVFTNDPEQPEQEVVIRSNWVE